ncbi:PREDICTED: uncharacterized protein LOC106324262 [Brassica oleracea var. oleracea]|uniref:uncharacterized protein LOC106324262 n=1 Tax=Brassica oleracea var. oleracea TaxID=109376 RepID=UPI0006A752F5|nr:PREDICTED: uncharacterized protein LOC106324262 [Brassica oleracea var. oleracea]
MGGSPPCGNSVRSVKDYRRQVATSQRWPTRPPSHPPITFSPDDAEGIHVPHNDPILVVLGIGEYDVTKVLVDTRSSVDLIFRGTLQKMGVDLDDIKPSSRTLTGFNGSSETILGTIRLPERACGVTRTIKSKAVNEEVDRLLGAGSIPEVRYPEWLANPVVVKKNNGKWRVCVDFTDLNKACPKDSYPLPNIDRLVETTAGNEMLTFMDAFSRYNQIMMHPDDREKTAFITNRGTYCYKVMPFGLKNPGATYQRLVNTMFADKLGVTMEIYIDDMLVKSLHAADHLRHLQDCFETLNKYGMKLNPAKCTFGVSSGEFLGYIVTQRGIEANPKQISAVLNLLSPKNSREVQRLTGRMHSIGSSPDPPTNACRSTISYEVTREPNRGKISGSCGFLIRIAPELEQDLTLPNPNWTLHVDGSSTNKGAGAGVQLQSPTGELISQSFSFGFPASNNEAEYESLIAGLRFAKAVKEKRLSAYCDSQLVARNDRMDAYLKIVQGLAAEFEFFELVKVPRGENVCADALVALGSKLRDQVKRTIPIHRIEKPSINISTCQTVIIAPVTETNTPDTDGFGPDWRTEFIDYLSKGELPTEKWAARRLKKRSAHYVVLDDEIQRWTASKVLLKCIHGDETVRVMAETNKGAGGNHSGGRALAIKVRSLGFFWPRMNTDFESYARSCDKCQRHAPSIHCPTEMLRTKTAPYPFMRWAMDIIGPLPCSRQRRFILVLTDYFTKWIEAEAYAQVTDKEVRGFVWKNIICRHGLPYEIVNDNGSQLMSGNFKEFCSKWNIRLSPSTPRYPQGNGQAESSNKLIIDDIKKRLDLKKGHWADELDGFLWSHRTTPRGSTKSTPFSLAYGTEAMAPAEVNVSSLRRSKMPSTSNSTRRCCLMPSTRLKNDGTKLCYESKTINIR